jgi:hypothetical protein
MNTEPKIRIITDPRSFRDSLNTSHQLLQQESGPIRQAILNRYRDTERRIGSTTDIHSLQRLNAFQKFLKAMATALDWRDAFIVRTVEAFNLMDAAYWDGVIRGQELIAENRSLKAEREGLYFRIEILEGALKKALQRHRKSMGHEQVEYQTNKYKAA